MPKRTVTMDRNTHFDCDWCAPTTENAGMTSTDDFLMALGGPSLIAWHHQNGIDRSAVEYLNSYRGLLVHGLSAARLIYLDTNFWIRMRDAEIGTGSPAAVHLLQTLRSMVRSREALCVSQMYSFLELGKQKETSLRVTAELLDELTEGVMIASPDDLLQWECAEFIKATLRKDVGHDLCPWTKVGQLHKNDLPTSMPGPVSDRQRDVILKASIDAAWNVTFNYILERFDWDTKNKLGFELDPETFASVTKRKAEQQAKGLTFDQVRLEGFSEILLSKAGPVFNGLLGRWHFERGFPEGMAALLRDADAVQHAAIQGFAGRSLGRLLPGLSIKTNLYTLYETDSQSDKPQTPNDWFDSCHAAVALPYCDMFFTERGLAHRLRQLLKADVQYGCEVVSTIEDAVTCLSNVP